MNSTDTNLNCRNCQSADIFGAWPCLERTTLTGGGSVCAKESYPEIEKHSRAGLYQTECRT